MSPEVWPGKPRDQVGQHRLAVAGDPGDADDLAFVHGERGPVQGGAGVGAGHGHVAQFEQRRAGLARGAAAGRHVAAHHQLGDAPPVGVSGRHLADLAPAAQHRDAVRHRQHLAQLVGDEDDREALRGEPADGVEQALGLEAASGPRSARPSPGCARRDTAP
jgi:hypothetical protein